MKVLVCGGRNFGIPKQLLNGDIDNKEYSFVNLILNTRVLDTMINPTIITGCARGVDRVATIWANVNSIPVRVFKARWKDYGKAAGHIRNKEMLDIGKPDLVIAFPGGKGTANMVEQAEKAGVPVEKYEYTETT